MLNWRHWPCPRNTTPERDPRLIDGVNHPQPHPHTLKLTAFGQDRQIYIEMLERAREEDVERWRISWMPTQDRFLLGRLEGWSSRVLFYWNRRRSSVTDNEKRSADLFDALRKWIENDKGEGDLSLHGVFHSDDCAFRDMSTLGNRLFDVSIPSDKQRWPATFKTSSAREDVSMKPSTVRIPTSIISS